MRINLSFLGLNITKKNKYWPNQRTYELVKKWGKNIPLRPSTQKKLESDLKIAQTMDVPKTQEIISTVTNLQTSTLKNQNHKKTSVKVNRQETKLNREDQFIFLRTCYYKKHKY